MRAAAWFRNHVYHDELMTAFFERGVWFGGA